MPLRVGIPYQPYSFLIKKLDGLIVAQDDKGRIRFSGTDAARVAQLAVDASPAGSAVVMAGDFDVYRKITGKVNVAIIGYNARLFWKGTSPPDPAMIDFGNNWYTFCEGLYLDGNGVAEYGVYIGWASYCYVNVTGRNFVEDVVRTVDCPYSLIISNGRIPEHVWIGSPDYGKTVELRFPTIKGLGFTKQIHIFQGRGGHKTFSIYNATDDIYPIESRLETGLILSGSLHQIISIWDVVAGDWETTPPGVFLCRANSDTVVQRFVDAGYPAYGWDMKYEILNGNPVLTFCYSSFPSEDPATHRTINLLQLEALEDATDALGIKKLWLKQKGVNVTVTAGFTSISVTLPEPEPDTNYGVIVTPGWDTSVWITDKTTSGFTINFGTPPTVDSALDWFVYR